MSGQHQPPDDDGRKPVTPPPKPADSRSAVVPPDRDALLAENQRLREALERLANPKWHPKSEEAALLIAEVEGIAREALAGDTE